MAKFPPVQIRLPTPDALAHAARMIDQVLEHGDVSDRTRRFVLDCKATMERHGHPLTEGQIRVLATIWLEQFAPEDTDGE